MRIESTINKKNRRKGESYVTHYNISTHIIVFMIVNTLDVLVFNGVQRITVSLARLYKEWCLDVHEPRQDKHPRMCAPLVDVILGRLF